MADIEPMFVGKTFDDFLFRPQHSPVRTRREVSLEMPLVPGLELALPVLGANMDTVVGEEMAKTLALEGGTLAEDLGRQLLSDPRALRARHAVRTRNTAHYYWQPPFSAILLPCTASSQLTSCAQSRYGRKPRIRNSSRSVGTRFLPARTLSLAANPMCFC